MFHLLYKSYKGSEIPVIKTWLNVLVKSRPNLNFDDQFDSNMMDAVRQFQLQNKAPLPDGRIDQITFYNIIRKIDPALINHAVHQNVAIRTMLANVSPVYDDEVHKNLTVALALGAGFNYLDAVAIGSSDVNRDYDPESNPMPQGAWDVASGSNKKRLTDWHFVSTARLNELDQIWRRSGSIVDLGKFMHTFQDSFSHHGLGPLIGQVGTWVDEKGEVHRTSTNSDDWHQVDDPSLRPSLAENMAQQTYDKLVEAAPIIYRKKPDVVIIYPPVGWAVISSDVRAFCTDGNAQSRATRADKLANRLEARQRNLTRIR